MEPDHCTEVQPGDTLPKGWKTEKRKSKIWLRKLQIMYFCPTHSQLRTSEVDISEGKRVTARKQGKLKGMYTPLLSGQVEQNQGGLGKTFQLRL